MQDGYKVTTQENLNGFQAAQIFDLNFVKVQRP
jgi:hypothetical protein